MKAYLKIEVEAIVNQTNLKEVKAIKVIKAKKVIKVKKKIISVLKYFPLRKKMLNMKQKRMKLQKKNKNLKNLQKSQKLIKMPPRVKFLKIKIVVHVKIPQKKEII